MPRPRSSMASPTSTGCDEILRGIRIADGKEVLNVASGAYTGASPAIAEGRAYYGTYDNEVLGVDLKTQEDPLDATSTPTATFPSIPRRPCPAGRIVVGGRDKLVHAIDRQTGKAAWTFSRPARESTLRPSLPAGASTSGRTTASSTSSTAPSGKSLFEFEAGGPLSASPAVASGRLVIGSQDGKLFCLG